MQIEFLLKGLDCPHCAGEIEKEVGALPGVTDSSMNLMRQVLTVETTDHRGLLDKVSRIVHTHEPGVRVSVYTERHTQDPEEEDDPARMLWRMGIGGALFVAGVALSFTRLPGWLSLALLIVAYMVLGYDVVLGAIRNLIRGRVFDENFLMSLSSIGAFCIGEHHEAVAVMLFYQIGEYFQQRAVHRSRRSIAQLMDIRPEFATVKRNGRFVTTSPETVSVGSILLVKPGERIPLDSIVVEGTSMLDTRALTGESVPKTVRPGDTALSGCVNGDGLLTLKVTKTLIDSTVTKILDLVENASGRKAKTENFITKFARYYTPAVVIVAALLAVLPPLAAGGGWADWIHRSFVFLVISCPCALVISIPLSFFGGIGEASRQGVLVKGGNFLEALNEVDTVVFDKTGTLTKGVFKVTQILPADGYTEADVLSLAAKAECFSSHPIALSVLAAYGKTVDTRNLTDYRQIPGFGVSIRLSSKQILAGSDRLMAENGISFTGCNEPGTKVYVAENGSFAGCIRITDQIKEDAKQAIRQLKAMGIRKTVLLTGDEDAIAADLAAKLELDEYHARLLPEEKVSVLERLDTQKAKGKKIAYVGDGINDAPVLARADVGIAMGALGSDAAIEAADVVLMTDEPGKLPAALAVARKTRRIVAQNIVLALGIKAAFLILGAFGIAGMWEAVFADVGVALLAVCNAMRILQTQK